MKKAAAALNIRGIALAVGCLSMFLLIVTTSAADTIFTGVGCPGLGFVAGVITTRADVDVEDICDFLHQGGGLSGPGFGLGNGGWPSRREEACDDTGGIWDGHRCIMPDPVPNPKPCPTCAPIPPTALILLPARPTMLYGLPVTFKGQRILVLVKPSYVKNKQKLLPILLGKKGDGTQQMSRPTSRATRN